MLKDRFVHSFQKKGNGALIDRQKVICEEDDCEEDDVASETVPFFFIMARKLVPPGAAMSIKWVLNCVTFLVSTTTYAS